MKSHSNLSRQERIEKVSLSRHQDICLVLENLTEGLNISAILRTAEGFGIEQVAIIHPISKKPHLSNTVSSGAVKWLKITYFTDTKKCLKSLKKQGFSIIGALVDPNAIKLSEADLSGKVAIVLGNEAKGLSEDACQLLDTAVYIPMFGLTESFNVGVSAGIFVYEIIRQKTSKKSP